MGWSTAQRRTRERHWPVVEGWLSGLPPALFRQAKLLEYDLALRYSQTGMLREIFLGADQPPVMSVPTWLLEDLDAPADTERTRVEGALVLVAMQLIARRHVVEGLFDETSFREADHVALVQLLSERAVTTLAGVIPAGSPFWDDHDEISLGQAERIAEQGAIERTTPTEGGPEAFLGAGWAATMGLVAAAALTVARRRDILPQTIAMLDALSAAFQIKDELEAMHANLLRGRPSYPIAVTASAAGISLRPPPPPELLLGAMVMTRSLEPILASALGRLNDARRHARDLALPSFRAYLDDAAGVIEDRIGTLSGDLIGGTPMAGRTAAAPLIARAEPTVAKAIAMAEGYLLSDLTFRESWESHREGMFGSAHVASRFPAGLVLEVLSAHDNRLTEHVDAFVAFSVANGFRYYDHPRSGIDADTIGVCLRLLPFAGAADRHLEALVRIVDVVGEAVRASGAVPVWFRSGDGSEEGQPAVIDLGEGCGTVAAHLLLGLQAFGAERQQRTLERGASHLLDRICAVGLGANVNYPPLYAIAAWFRLVSSLKGTRLAELAGNVERALLPALEALTKTRPPSAQAAALSTIACLDAGHPQLIDSRWVVTVLKQQRFDGSWIGEPFAAAPNRARSVTWYSSTVLTSALCYDALKRWEREGPRNLASSAGLTAQGLMTA